MWEYVTLAASFPTAKKFVKFPLSVESNISEGLDAINGVQWFHVTVAITADHGVPRTTWVLLWWLMALYELLAQEETPLRIEIIECSVRQLVITG